MMRRVLSVWLPTFSTDLVARRLKRSGGSGEAPASASVRGGSLILLTRAVASRELVVRCCARAAAAGVAEGMDLAHARSLLPASAGVHAEEHRPDREAGALHALACWALRFAPIAAPDPPDGLLIDISGTERLHRSEARLIRAVAAGIERSGIRARVVAAATFAGAWGVARFGAPDLAGVPTGGEKEAIAGLPVAALKVEASIAAGLGEIGVTRVGHLLDLRRSSIAARFGPVLLERLDQALGRATETIEPVRPVPPPRAELLFDGPTDRWESIEAAARQVIGDLAKELARRDRGVRRLDLALLRPREQPERLQITLSRPSRSAKHLWALARSRLERVDLSVGVEGVVAIATRTARLRHGQATIAGTGAQNERDNDASWASSASWAWGELVDTLVGRLGADGVVKIEPVESHLPERAFRERSVLEEGPPRGAPPAVTSADRPTRLFARPEPVEAMSLTPDGPILSMNWRERLWHVISCSGPERISAEWWRWSAAGGEADAGPRQERGRRSTRHRRAVGPPPPDRDYFAAQLETGRWVWVCRQIETGRWFVHGEWS